MFDFGIFTTISAAMFIILRVKVEMVFIGKQDVVKVTETSQHCFGTEYA